MGGAAWGCRRIEQVWFAGVHSNVGGGYPRQGMSLVALDWMMTRAEARGLRFLPEVRELYRGTRSVNDKAYDSRAGLGVFYRWKPRDVARLCEQPGVAPSCTARSSNASRGIRKGTPRVRCRPTSK